jgi:hypothetical protein
MPATINSNRQDKRARMEGDELRLACQDSACNIQPAIHRRRLLHGLLDKLS